MARGAVNSNTAHRLGQSKNIHQTGKGQGPAAKVQKRVQSPSQNIRAIQENELETACR